MSRFNKQATFTKDGYKLIICRNCGRIIGETHLEEKNTRTVTCKECKNIQVIAPPRLSTVNNKKGAFWCEPSDSCFTAFA
jgi:ribosomal protein S27E